MQRALAQKILSLRLRRLHALIHEALSGAPGTGIRKPKRPSLRCGGVGLRGLLEPAKPPLPCETSCGAGQEKQQAAGPGVFSRGAFSGCFLGVFYLGGGCAGGGGWHKGHFLCEHISHSMPPLLVLAAPTTMNRKQPLSAPWTMRLLLFITPLLVSGVRVHFPFARNSLSFVGTCCSSRGRTSRCSPRLDATLHTAEHNNPARRSSDDVTSTM